MYDRHLRHHAEPGTITVIGETRFRNASQRFGLRDADRLRHLYLLGKTGTGKSTALLAQIAQDLERGHGVAVLDPHGELVESALSLVPRSRTNEVTLIEVPDTRAVSLNVFRAGRCLHTDPSRFASEFVSAVRRVWSDSWGPRLEHLLRTGTIAVASHPRASLVLLYRFYTDEGLRSRVVARCPDPFVKAFWQREFSGYSRNFQAEALSPVLNKLGALLSSGALAHILGSERSRLDVDKLLETRGILLANLSVGHFGEDGSALLGSLLLSLIQLAAFRRRPGQPPFYVYVDEFHRFATETTGILLAEGRKFGVGLVIAHQFLAQLPEEIRAGVLGNVGTKLLFRLGAEDAESLAPEVGPAFLREDLATMGAFTFAAKVLVGGLELPPFSARTVLPVAPSSPASPAAIRAASGLHHGVDRRLIAKHLDQSFTSPPFTRPAERSVAPSARPSSRKATRSGPSGDRARASKGRSPKPTTHAR